MKSFLDSLRPSFDGTSVDTINWADLKQSVNALLNMAESGTLSESATESLVEGIVEGQIRRTGNIIHLPRRRDQE